MPSERTIHIVDDDAAVRRSLERLLGRAGYKTVAYASALLALSASEKLTEGCMLVDIRMPGMDGIELQEKLNGVGVCLPLIAMTGQGDVGTAVRVMKAGAVDFIEKPFSDECLFKAIELGFSSAERLSREQEASQAAKRIAALSRRERDVLDGLLAGQPNKIIAHNLGLSVRTVEVHRARMMERLGTRQFADVIRLAVLSMQTPGGDGSHNG